MDRAVIAYSAVGVAIVTSGIATWALFKWHNASKRLKKYVDKYSELTEVQKHMIHHFACLEDLPHLKSLIPRSSINYHARLAQFVSDVCDENRVPKLRILDVGCGPGATSFNLSSAFEEVIGTDTSVVMITAGQTMKQYAEFSSPFSDEGGKHITLLKTRVPNHANRERVVFWDEDVCALSYKCGTFDCVIVSNALSDLHNPEAFLQDIEKYVKEGGLLIISDVYNWENGPEEIFGGDGNVLTFSLLKNVLNSSWALLKEDNMSYYFPKCARLAEVGNSHVTVWKKREE